MKRKPEKSERRLCSGTGWIDETHDGTGYGRNKACPGCAACAKNEVAEAMASLRPTTTAAIRAHLHARWGPPAAKQPPPKEESQKPEVTTSSMYVVLRLPRVPAEMAGFGVALDERRRPFFPDEARELATELLAAADQVDLATGRKRPRGATGRYLCPGGCGGEVNSDGDSARLCDNCIAADEDVQVEEDSYEDGFAGP